MKERLVGFFEKLPLGLVLEKRDVAAAEEASSLGCCRR